MGKSVLKDKSYAFAIAIVKIVQVIQKDRKEYVLSKQILRSGTAVGALIVEAEFGQSKADFIHKLTISLKTENGLNEMIIKDHDDKPKDTEILSNQPMIYQLEQGMPAPIHITTGITDGNFTPP